MTEPRAARRVPGNRLAIYPGSFDPITNGHIDIVHRSLACFDRVIVAVANNVRKNQLFSVEERMAQVREVVADPRCEVETFEGLLMDYVVRRKAHVIVRGLRALADFEYEFQLAHMNRRLAPDVETARAAWDAAASSTTAASTCAPPFATTPTLRWPTTSASAPAARERRSGSSAPPFAAQRRHRRRQIATHGGPDALHRVHGE